MSDPAHIHVCPLASVAETLTMTRASRIITLMRPPMMLPTPDGILASHHLTLAINDIPAPQDGLVHPAEEHIATLLAFVAAWRGEGHLLVHCYAGISRSTAAALITLAAMNPGLPEAALARTLRETSPTAQPNPLMIRLADHALDRGGRLVSAVAALGPAALAPSGRPFSIPARHVEPPG